MNSHILSTFNNRNNGSIYIDINNHAVAAVTNRFRRCFPLFTPADIKRDKNDCSANEGFSSPVYLQTEQRR